MKEKLYPVAEMLMNDLEKRRQIQEYISKWWEKDDAQWKAYLRWFNRWILPRKKDIAHLSSVRKVGGLSLTRIAIITEFRRKVQVGFYTRQKINGTRDTLLENFAGKAMMRLEYLREQRIKQLASRITEAALGLGSENLKHWEKGRKRPREIINERRFASCHAIVIENLTHYRPEQTRTRRENRQLMSWAAANVKKYLSEQCELHGLFLREISASYTSRQDSRTGAPGLRCAEVPLQHLLKFKYWVKQLKKAEEKVENNKGDARDRYLVKLKKMIIENKPLPETVLVPVSGGEIFVSADDTSPIANGINADINAAVNIGLRALMDPDWAGKWWYVTCNAETFVPDAEQVKGCPIFETGKPLKKIDQQQGEAKSANKKKKITKSGGKINLWRDVSTKSFYDTGEWKEFAPYWNIVQHRVIKNLEKMLKIW